MTFAFDVPLGDAFIGERAWVLARRQGLKQKDFSAVLHLSQPSVSAKLKGRTPFLPMELIAVARLVNTTVAYLVGETDDPTRDPSKRAIDGL